MTYQNYSHSQMQALDAAHHLHPFTDHKDLREAGSRIIVRGEGPYVYDLDGNQILDGMAGLWCVNVGYGRDELAEVAASQMRELPYYNSFFRCSTPTPVLLAQKLAEIAPAHVNQVFYGSSGSEANDTALRLVRHYWALEGKPEKNAVISRQWAYHGSTIAGASLGGMTAMHGQLHGAVPNIHHVMPPYAFELAKPGESDEEFGLRAAKAVEDKILELGADKVAAFIGEPIQGAGGVRIPPASYWPEIQRICRKYDVLLMLDEVITGYGRTGAWFAAQAMGIEPDTMTTAKALTSGYQPLSALLVGDRIARTVEEKGGEFFHGYTYSGHPAACAAGLATLDIYEREGLFERSAEMSDYFLDAIWSLKDLDIVRDLRGYGMMAGVELHPEAGKPGIRGQELQKQLFWNGCHIKFTGDTGIVAPSLIAEKQDIDLIIEVLRETLEAI